MGDTYPDCDRPNRRNAEKGVDPFLRVVEGCGKKPTRLSGEDVSLPERVG